MSYQSCHNRCLNIWVYTHSLPCHKSDVFEYNIKCCLQRSPEISSSLHWYVKTLQILQSSRMGCLQSKRQFNQQTAEDTEAIITIQSNSGPSPNPDSMQSESQYKPNLVPNHSRPTHPNSNHNLKTSSTLNSSPDMNPSPMQGPTPAQTPSIQTKCISHSQPQFKP